MRRLSMVGLALLLAACQGEDYERDTYKELNFSMRALDAWSLERQPGAVIYVADPDLYGTGVTITVQSSPKMTPDRRDLAAPVMVFAATEKVLRAMPDAEIAGPVMTARGDMQAAYYHASFRPRDREDRYERTHVVLVGRQRVFHVMHTGPVGALGPSADLFEEVVTSMRERS